MSRVTIYLDAATEALMDAAAKSAGVSHSRWIAAAVRERVCGGWPASLRNPGDAFAGFPEIAELREAYGQDASRAC
jgi:hypothetical protein